MCKSIGDNPNRRLSHVGVAIGDFAFEPGPPARRGQAFRSGDRHAAHRADATLNRVRPLSKPKFASRPAPTVTARPSAICTEGGDGWSRFAFGSVEPERPKTERRVDAGAIPGPIRACRAPSRAGPSPPRVGRVEQHDAGRQRALADGQSRLKAERRERLRGEGAVGGDIDQTGIGPRFRRGRAVEGNDRDPAFQSQLAQTTRDMRRQIADPDDPVDFGRAVGDLGERLQGRQHAQRPAPQTIFAEDLQAASHVGQVGVVGRASRRSRTYSS